MKPDLWSERNRKIKIELSRLPPQKELELAYKCIERYLRDFALRISLDDMLQFLSPAICDTNFVLTLLNELLGEATQSKWHTSVQLPEAKRIYTTRELVEKLGLYKFLN